MQSCATHDRTAPVATFADAVRVVNTSLVLEYADSALMAEVVTSVGTYRDNSCCAAGAFARWLCSAAWRTRQVAG